MSFAYLALYTGDYLRDTRHLAPLKHGVYLLLLMHCWDQKGPLPLDEQECAGISNCRSADEVDALRYILNKYFVCMADGWYNKRMAEEIVRAEEKSASYRKAGLRSAEVRRSRSEVRSAASEQRLNRGSTTVEQRLNHGATAGGSPTTTSSTSTTTPTSPEIKELRSSTWEAYRSAYASRYGIDPVRNASVNSMLATVVNKLGQSAPQVVQFYLTHNDPWYIKKNHPASLLTKDAEGLHTQWKRGKRTTTLEARSAEEKDAVREQVNRVVENMEAKREQKDR